MRSPDLAAREPAPPLSEWRTRRPARSGAFALVVAGARVRGCSRERIRYGVPPSAFQKGARTRPTRGPLHLFGRIELAMIREERAPVALGALLRRELELGDGRPDAGEFLQANGERGSRVRLEPHRSVLDLSQGGILLVGIGRSCADRARLSSVQSVDDSATARRGDSQVDFEVCP